MQNRWGVPCCVLAMSRPFFPDTLCGAIALLPPRELPNPKVTAWPLGSCRAREHPPRRANDALDGIPRISGALVTPLYFRRYDTQRTVACPIARQVSPVSPLPDTHGVLIDAVSWLAGPRAGRSPQVRLDPVGRLIPRAGLGIFIPKEPGEKSCETRDNCLKTLSRAALRLTRFKVKSE